MRFEKRPTGEHARLRFERELSAHAEAARFWTCRVSGWRHAELLEARPADLLLTFPLVVGVRGTWADAMLVAHRLAGAISRLAAESPARSDAALGEWRRELDTLIGADAAARVMDLAERRGGPLCRVHGDLRPDNVLRVSDELVLVDWELSRPGLVVEDAGGLIAHAAIAERRGVAPPGLVEMLLAVIAEVLPGAVARLLAQADLRRQERRERALGNAVGAEERVRVAEALVGSGPIRIDPGEPIAPHFAPLPVGEHRYFIRCAAISPDGARLATGDEENRVTVWDGPGAASLHLYGHRDAVYALRFLDEGRLLTGSWDRSVRLWDARRGQIIRVLRGHVDRVDRVAGCLDPGRIVSADESGEILEFDLADGRLLARWLVHENRVRALIVWPGQGWLSTGDDGRVIERRWDMAEPRQRAWLPTACYGLAGPLSDGRWVALGADGVVRAVDLKEEGEPAILLRDDQYLRSADISPDGRRLAAAGKSGRLHIWSPDGEEHVAPDLGGGILDVRWLSTEIVVGCGRGGLVFRALRVAPGRWSCQRLEGHVDHVFAIAVDPTRARFYTGAFDRRVLSWRRTWSTGCSDTAACS